MSECSPGLPGSGDLTLYRFPGSPSDISFFSGQEKPDYVLHSFTEQIYKLVRFNRSDGEFLSLKKQDKSLQQSNDNKLLNNLSRARSMVLQYALCNPWDWFFTGTLDRLKFDRYDLDTYKSKLSQFVRDLRKKYGTQIQYLFVPERHKDGAWHIHGLLSGVPVDKLSDFIPGVHPQRLVDGHYKNWTDYYDKFGFCSLGHICDPVACAFYISKYLSKDMVSSASDLGRHLYLHSRPLSTAVKIANSYGRQPELDQYIQQNYDFCSVGMIYAKDWTYACAPPFTLDLPDFLHTITSEELPPTYTFPDCPEWEQMQIGLECAP